MFRELLLTPNRYGHESGGVGKVIKLSFEPYKVLLKRTPYVAVALFLVQNVSGIREGNEVQVVDEPDFNVYASDAAMSSSSHVNVFYNIISNIFCEFCKRSIRYIWNYTIKRN